MTHCCRKCKGFINIEIFSLSSASTIDIHTYVRMYIPTYIPTCGNCFICEGFFSSYPATSSVQIEFIWPESLDYLQMLFAYELFLLTIFL